MLSSPRLRAPWIPLLCAALPAGGCSFDTKALDAHRCKVHADCGVGFCTDEGFCLATGLDAGGDGPDGPIDAEVDMCVPGSDDDADGVDNCMDNCIAVANMTQNDIDSDRAGNECDCLPANAAYAMKIAVSDFDADADSLVGVTGTWSVTQNRYRQATTDGKALAWAPGAVSRDHFADTVLQVTLNGAQAFGRNAAGLMIRASNLTATGGTAYLCGVDLASPRTLFLARADFAGTGTLTELASSPIQPTFSLDPGAQNWTGFHALNVATEGDTMTCRLRNGSMSNQLVEVSASDATLTGGSAGFFAFGTSVDFGNINACGDPP